MNVEYTGRQIEITPAIRKQVDSGLTKIAKIVGSNIEAKVIVSVEKHRHLVDITLTSRNRNALVGVGESKDLVTALDDALEHIERQVLKNKGRWRNLKRQPKKEKEFAATEEPEVEPVASRVKAGATIPVAVHSFPPKAHRQEAHIIPSNEAVALRPMTLEEAVKEAEFRDQDVFIFQERKSGKTTVLHRRNDGKVELIEVP
jgi:putative sigma-54 modulation protein